MRLTVVGSSGGITLTEAATSGYLVTSGGVSLLLDCGPGVATRLRRFTRLDTLVGVVLSHLHFDHFYDLLPLAGMVYGDQVDNLAWEATHPHAPRPHTRLPVCLPPGGKDYLRRVTEAVADPAGPSGETLTVALTSPLAPHEYVPGEPFAVGPFSVTAIGPVAHGPGPCFGLRVSDGHVTLGYTGDSAMCDALDDIARDADLFLCDATGITSGVRMARHLSADEAGQVASRAAAKRLVLTHLARQVPSWHDAMRQAARALYNGPIAVAAAGRKFVITPSVQR